MAWCLPVFAEVFVAGSNGLITGEWNEMTWPRRLTRRIKGRTQGGEWWWPSSVLFCGISMTVETMPTARKYFSCSWSPGTKCNVSESCFALMIKCWASDHWRLVFVCALTIHNDDLINAGWMSGWIAINTRFVTSTTVVRKHSFVTLGKRISINSRFRGYYLVRWLRNRATKLTDLLHRTSLAFLDTRGLRTASECSCPVIWNHANMENAQYQPRLRYSSEKPLNEPSGSGSETVQAASTVSYNLPS